MSLKKYERKVGSPASLWDEFEHKVIIDVCSASDLKADKKIYCRVFCGPSKARTPSVRGRTDPTWNSRFFFACAANAVLRFEVFEEKSFGADTFLGEVLANEVGSIPVEKPLRRNDQLEHKADSKRRSKNDVVGGTLSIRVYHSTMTRTRPAEGQIGLVFSYRHLIDSFRTGDIILYEGTGLEASITKLVSHSRYSNVGLVVLLPNKWTDDLEPFVLECCNNEDEFLDAMTENTSHQGWCLFRLKERIHHYYGHGKVWWAQLDAQAVVQPSGPAQKRETVYEIKPKVTIDGQDQYPATTRLPKSTNVVLTDEDQEHLDAARERMVNMAWEMHTNNTDTQALYARMYEAEKKGTDHFNDVRGYVLDGFHKHNARELDTPAVVARIISEASKGNDSSTSSGGDSDGRKRAKSKPSAPPTITPVQLLELGFHETPVLLRDYNSTHHTDIVEGRAPTTPYHVPYGHEVSSENLPRTPTEIGGMTTCDLTVTAPAEDATAAAAAGIAAAVPAAAAAAVDVTDEEANKRATYFPPTGEAALAARQGAGVAAIAEWKAKRVNPSAYYASRASIRLKSTKHRLSHSIIVQDEEEDIVGGTASGSRTESRSPRPQIGGGRDDNNVDGDDDAAHDAGRAAVVDSEANTTKSVARGPAVATTAGAPAATVAGASTGSRTTQNTPPKAVPAGTRPRTNTAPGPSSAGSRGAPSSRPVASAGPRTTGGPGSRGPPQRPAVAAPRTPGATSGGGPTPTTSTATRTTGPVSPRKVTIPLQANGAAPVLTTGSVDRNNSPTTTSAPIPAGATGPSAAPKRRENGPAPGGRGLLNYAGGCNTSEQAYQEQEHQRQIQQRKQQREEHEQQQKRPQRPPPVVAAK